MGDKEGASLLVLFENMKLCVQRTSLFPHHYKEKVRGKNMREAKANVPLDFILGGKNAKDGTKGASKWTNILLIYNKPVPRWEVPVNVYKWSALSSPFDWLGKPNCGKMK